MNSEDVFNSHFAKFESDSFLRRSFFARHVTLGHQLARAPVLLYPLLRYALTRCRNGFELKCRFHPLEASAVRRRWRRSRGRPRTGDSRRRGDSECRCHPLSPEAMAARRRRLRRQRLGRPPRCVLPPRCACLLTGEAPR